MRWFLLTFSPIYRVVIYVRNKFFDVGIFKSVAFKIPVISIGNITVGGTGKTPHIEYLVSLLKDQHPIATLSRGYKRKTKGFFQVQTHSKVEETGDEPLQLKRKFPDITVAVDEKRVHGVQHLLNLNNPPGIILLDDAFQHRHIKPGLNILLVDYNRPIHDDFLLPAGRLREPVHNISRAHVVIVTKCPTDLKPIDFRIIQKHLNLYPYQDLFFTGFDYADLQPVFGKGKSIATDDLKKYVSLLVTGIANPEPMYHYFKSVDAVFEKMAFADHHDFSETEITQIINRFELMKDNEKLIVCTEKDAVRLRDAQGAEKLGNLPLYYLPVKVRFLNDCSQAFDSVVRKFIARF